MLGDDEVGKHINLTVILLNWNGHHVYEDHCTKKMKKVM